MNMKIKNILKTALATCFVAVLTPSCSDWLAVDMEDEIMEDKLYETNEGFVSALNGVYAKMNETYSTTMSMTVLDVMARYYNVAQNSNHVYYNHANYSFNEENVENTSGNIWTGLYSLIANLNLLLEHCDAPESAISQRYYPIVKGEALALRAMFHFDLLRIYGPIYGADTENMETIPYAETSSKEIQPLLPAKEIMAKVIRDLKAAAELLKDDKIRTDGVMNSESEDPNETSDFRYRQYRLNYYAVQGLLARAYLWMGDKANAYDCARGIILENEEKEIFPWTPKNKVQDQDTPDRIFSSEVIFCLYNLSRVNVFDSYFSRNASINTSLTFVGKDFTDTSGKMPYFYSDVNDLRRGDNIWSIESLQETNANTGAASTTEALCFSKFADVGDNSIRYMVPLLRMSEIYLIAAECTDNMEEALGYVNAIRDNRNCVDIDGTQLTEEALLEYITQEFAREVIGEGQLYFYYKRHAMTEILSGSTFTESWWSGLDITDEIDLQDYVWPLPKVETDKRVTE